VSEVYSMTGYAVCGFGAGYCRLYFGDEECEPSLSRPESSAAIVLRWPRGAGAADVEGAPAARARGGDAATGAPEQCGDSVECRVAGGIYAGVSRGLGGQRLAYEPDLNTMLRIPA